jgi:hypothetical protein
MLRRVVTLFCLSAVALAACSAPTAQPPTPTNIGQAAAPTPAVSADLSGIQTYLTDQSTKLQASTAGLKALGQQYFDLAQGVSFDYALLWQDHAAEVVTLVTSARAAWTTASPLYEQVEGIVAGTPSLAEFDVILDAGASGAEDPQGAAPYDLTLADGRVLSRPGNLFGVNESALWGTWPEFTAPVEADFDADGQIEFGEALPDAHVLQAASATLDQYAGELLAAAQAWQPTASDAFTALVVMVPTMSEYFDSWKNSRFVAGDASTQRDFVAISRLADIQGILGSLEVVHQNVSPLIEGVDPAQDAEIGQGLADLKAFVADVYRQEMAGKRFSAEEADLLGAEAQNRATAITGKVSQVAAQLNIPIAE